MSGYASWRPAGGMNTHRCVKNVNGTSADRYAVPHLKQKYSEFASYPSTCQVLGCSDHATATAHVISCDGRSGGSWSLVPVCAAHNNHYQTEPMYLKTSAQTVRLSKVRR